MCEMEKNKTRIVMKRFILYCLTAIFAYQANAQFSGKGSGTQKDPYLVETALNVEEIRNFQSNYSVWFKLTNDIDMSELIRDTYGGYGWNPIPKFYGKFDGNGHVISGLFIERYDGKNAGFFRDITDAYIHDLILDYTGDVYSSGDVKVGGLCAITYGSSNIERCMVKGTNFSGGTVGGLIGCVTDQSRVNECVVECNEVRGSSACGGLVGNSGYNSEYRFINNRVYVNQILCDGTSAKYAGGILGYQLDSGGLGYNLFEGKVCCKNNNYVDRYVGGIGGSVEGIGGNVAICDSVISIGPEISLNAKYSTYIGRIAGSGGSDPTSVHANRAYNQMVLYRNGSSIYYGSAPDSYQNGMGVGNIMLKSKSMYGGMGWDMDNVWTIEDGKTYPRLKWEVDKGLNKPLLYITKNNVEVEENAILTFDAEKVMTNIGGGITYTYYQCVPDEPVISNFSNSIQQVTVTVSSDDYSHLKWAGINGKNADMTDVSETRSCQLGKGASIPLNLHAVFADQDFGSYTATVEVSCGNFTRTFQIRFLYENPDKPICPTPFIDYADGTLVFSCGADGKPEYHVRITNSDVNTYVVDNELKLDRTYNIEVYATAEGYLASDSTKLILCWIDSKNIDETDGLIKEEGLPIQIRRNNETITVAGIAKNTLVSAYSLAGTLLDSTTSQAEKVTLNIPNSIEVIILKIGDNSIKITF